MAVDVAERTAAEVFVDVVAEIDLAGQLAGRPDLLGKLIGELLAELGELARDAHREGRIL